MTYPLGDFMLKLRNDLQAVEPSTVANSDLVSIAWYAGKRWLAANGRRCPSYCWYPGNITPAPPFKGDLGANTSATTGIENVEVHSWGSSDEASWMLRHNLIGAAKKLYGADCQYLGCTFWDGDDQGFGSGYVTRLSFKVPIIEAVLDIATITAVNETGFLVINGTPIQGC